MIHVLSFLSYSAGIWLKVFTKWEINCKCHRSYAEFWMPACPWQTALYYLFRDLVRRGKQKSKLSAWVAVEFAIALVKFHHSALTTLYRQVALRFMIQLGEPVYPPPYFLCVMPVWLYTWATFYWQSLLHIFGMSEKCLHLCWVAWSLSPHRK